MGTAKWGVAATPSFIRRGKKSVLKDVVQGNIHTRRPKEKGGRKRFHLIQELKQESPDVCRELFVRRENFRLQR